MIKAYLKAKESIDGKSIVSSSSTDAHKVSKEGNKSGRPTRKQDEALLEQLQGEVVAAH